MILPIHSRIDYNKFKFNLKTVARHTSALVFENSIHGWQPIIIVIYHLRKISILPKNL